MRTLVTGADGFLHGLIAAAAGVPDWPTYAQARNGEVHASALNPTRARQVLGWTPETRLDEGVKFTVDRLRATLESPSAVPA